MQRFGFLIAAILLVGQFSGGVAELADRLGIQTWLQTTGEAAEASDNRLQTKASNPER